jgi:choline dehydrogenase-like flavoprotein
VILSCGAHGSPLVLEHSGVGNPEIVKRGGADLVVDLPGVGENYNNDYMVIYAYKSGLDLTRHWMESPPAPIRSRLLGLKCYLGNIGLITFIRQGYTLGVHILHYVYNMQLVTSEVSLGRFLPSYRRSCLTWFAVS